MPNQLTLNWSDQIREFLQQKCMQYLSRICDPCENEENRRDALYKAAIAQTLINNGRASYEDVEARLNHLLRGNYDERGFKKAWDVIGDYNQTGGKNILQRSDQAIRV